MIGLQISLAFRYLWGRKLRTGLTTLAIVFGTLVIFGMNILMPTMMKAFQANALAASGQVDVTISHKTGEAFSSSVLNRVKTVQGIRSSAGSLSRTVNIPENYYRNAKITALTLTGVEPRAAQMLRNYPVQQGRFLRLNDAADAVITTSLAESLDLELGDKLSVPTTDGDITLKVVGLLPARALPGNEEILVTLTEAQKLFDLPKRINTIEANLDTTDQTERDAIQQSLETALGEDFMLGALASGSEILSSIQMGQVLFNLFGVLALFMGGFIIFNTFRTIVVERRHDIGMLRAIGANRSTIIGMFLVEGIIQGAVGTLAGMLLGYLMGAGLLLLMEPMMSQFLHLQMGAPVVQPWLILVTSIAGVGVTLLAGVLPAFNASRVTPLEALRPTLNEAVQKTARISTIIGGVLIALAILGMLTGNTGLTALGGMFFLIGLVMIAPALIRPIAALFSKLVVVTFAREGTGELAQSNLTRQPSRAAITASATMIGLAVIVGMGGMIWSVTGGFLEVMERSLGSDYLVMPPSVSVWKTNVGAKQDLAQKLRNIPGVQVVSSMRFAAATIDGTTISLLGINPTTYPQVASLTFQKGNADSYAEIGRERALIVNGVLASQKELEVNDMVQLSTSTGLKTYRIAAVAGDFLNAKLPTAYISQDNLHTDFHKNEDILFQINVANNANEAMMEQRLKQALEKYPQFKLISGKKYFSENKQLFDAVFVIYFVMLGVLAIPSLIAMLNTLAIGVIERTREIGMLRAIGATRKQVRRMVIAEALLLAAIGTAFGLLAGLYLGYMMIMGLSAFGYPVTYSFPYVAMLVAIAVGLLFGVLAALLPARQAAQMEIVRALRYE